MERLRRTPAKTIKEVKILKHKRILLVAALALALILSVAALAGLFRSHSGTTDETELLGEALAVGHYSSSDTAIDTFRQIGIQTESNPGQVKTVSNPASEATFFDKTPLPVNLQSSKTQVAIPTGSDSESNESEPDPASIPVVPVDSEPIPIETEPEPEIVFEPNVHPIGGYDSVEEETPETAPEESEADDEEDDDYNDIRLCGYGGTKTVIVYDKDRKAVAEFEVVLYDLEDEGLNYEDGQRFFADVLAIVSQYEHEGIPTCAMLAQAYTEGGCGKLGVYRQSNNLFGMRAGPQWEGYVYARDLRKTFASYSDARKRGGTDLFRAYESMNDSVRDYIELISGSELYRSALGKSDKEYLQKLTAAGYGDGRMVSVWLSVIEAYQISELIAHDNKE